ncbi:MAG: dihydrodipicolinate reductase [Bacteroidota bacterium]|nr:dihydrodipicolinate reductase [Bacteroidota bacterium]
MQKTNPIKAVLIGAGPLGINIYKYAQTRKDIRITHVIDIDTSLSGRDIGEHAGLDATGIAITNSYEGLSNCQVAILATVSDLPRIATQILQVIELGLPIVTTCEEMFFPWNSSDEWSKTIDLAAKDKGVAVLGTGVNPGFLMDALPMMLSGVCHHVDRIEVRRYQDAQFRRIPFQKKIGAGLSYEEFEKRKNEGSLRHVGLSESMHFIAHQLGWKLDKTEDKIEPVVSERNYETDALQIKSGQVAGIRQTGRGYVGGEERIKLAFQATVGEAEQYDEIEIYGTPHIRSRIIGGVHGDIATSSIILNACRSVLHAAPGLRTMADVPMITSVGT